MPDCTKLKKSPKGFYVLGTLISLNDDRWKEEETSSVCGPSYTSIQSKLPIKEGRRFDPLLHKICWVLDFEK